MCRVCLRAMPRRVSLCEAGGNSPTVGSLREGAAERWRGAAARWREIAENSSAKADKLRFKAAVLALRTGASITPKKLEALRFVCDTPVPTLALPGTASHCEDKISTPEGREICVEWVRPTPSDTEVERSMFSRSVLQRRASAPAVLEEEQRMRPPAVILLYMHGGAYVLCKPGSLRGITYALADALNTTLCVPQYRRPPEHPIPAPMEDALAVYRHLLQQYPHSQIIIGGESAGGGIVAALLAALREENLPQPPCAFLISPWTDLSGDGMQNLSMHNEVNDYLPSPLVSWIAKHARGHLADHDWRASPVYVEGSLEQLPPTLVVYGEDELLRAQVEHFCEVWRSRGAPLRSHGVEGGVHAPVLFSWCHDHAQTALDELAAFVSEHTRLLRGG